MPSRRLAPRDAQLPAPGTRGNPDNVPFIGRPDPKGNPVRLAKATGHVSNYSEERVRPYTLPDPLVMASGERVTNADQWFKARRPEILKLYRDEIYGRVPAGAPQGDLGGDGDGYRRPRRHGDHEARGRQDGDKAGRPADEPDGVSPGQGERAGAGAPEHHLRFRPGRAPSSRRKDRRAPARRAGEGRVHEIGRRERARPGGFDSVGEVLDRGWGYASLPYGEIQPDRADRWKEGVIGLTLKEGQARPAPDEWGTISAWAWGISRAIDYLESDPSIDAKRIAITGVSRLGKTVLWAGAQDERVAAVFSVVSGEMGAALIRRDWGETLDDMAQNFPWQFAGNLQKWAGRWEELPVDQHMLIALCAPRPVYVNGGLTDQWSDPKGEFLALVAAGPVYRLLGGKGLGVTELPPLDAPVDRRRPGVPLSQRWAHGGPGRLEEPSSISPNGTSAHGRQSDRGPYSAVNLAVITAGEWSPCAGTGKAQ